MQSGGLPLLKRSKYSPLYIDEGMGAANTKTYAYCPAGFRWNTLDINGTLFLTCDPVSEQNQNNDVNLILGLCIGIPLCVVFLILSYRFYCKNIILEKNRLGQDPVKVFPQEVVTRELTPESLIDFRNGNLSNTLKDEIMLLRIQKGRDLTEFVKYAEICEQAELAHWLHNLNPLDIPPEIHRRAHNYQV